MNPVGSNSMAAQMYSGIQRTGPDSGRAQSRAPNNLPALDSAVGRNDFNLPAKATPRGDWVLSENANPQSFDANSPRGTYLNMVV